jgi:hypothetical protein
MDTLVAAMLEASRWVGAATRRLVFRLKWEESNDGVDTSIGLAVISIAILVVAAVARRVWSQ